MFVEEPPLSHAEEVAAKVSRVLLFIMCGGPIAAFPIGIAYKVFVHYFG